MSRDMVLTLADMRQRDLLEEHQREELARLLAPTRQPLRLVVANWLHAMAARLEGHTVVLQVEHARR